MTSKTQVTLTFAGDSKDVEKAFDRVGESAKDMSKDVRRSSESFDKVGEGFDTIDTRAMGFRDAITGVQDSAEGFRKLSEGDIAGGLFTLGMGIGDLASSMVNLIVPMAKTAAATVANWATMSASSLAGAASVALSWVIAFAPIIIVTALVIALAIVVVKNWDTIKEWTAKAWDFVKDKTLAVWNAVSDAVRDGIQKVRDGIAWGIDWVKSNWPLLLTILTGPFGLAAAAIIKKRDKIMDALRRVPGMVRSALSTVADAITAPFRRGFGAIRGIWNRTIGGKGFSIPSWVPEIGGKSFRIPRLHSGGQFNAPFGQSEGLAILRDGERIVTPGAARSRGRDRGGPMITINMAGSVVSERDLIDVITNVVSERNDLVGVVR